MTEIIKTLAGTPIPTILVVAGVLFLLLSVADKVSGQLSVSEQRKKYAAAAGIILLAAGLAINMLEKGPSEPSQEKLNTPALGEGADTLQEEVFRPSFNCPEYAKKDRSERTPIEDLLCTVKSLAELDYQLLEVYTNHLYSSKTQGSVRKEQISWLEMRNNERCPTTWDDLKDTKKRKEKVDCLKDEVEARLEYFDKLSVLAPTVLYSLRFPFADLEIGNKSGKGIIFVKDLTLHWDYQECSSPSPRVMASMREIPQYTVKITQSRGSEILDSREFEYPPDESDKFEIYMMDPHPGIYTVWVEFKYHEFPANKNTLFETEKKIKEFCLTR